ncbi:MAG: outer membrane protein transport protein, partial [Vibrio sp.]
RAYAGEAAMADNASAQWRNPAMLTYLEGTQISVGAIYVNPNVDVDGTINQKLPASSKDFAHDAVIPNFYLSHQLNEQVVLGFALGTNYGMETDLGTDFAASHFGNQASVISKEANLNIAYQILPQLSIGGGVRYVMGEGHFGATVPPQLNAVKPGFAGQTLKYMEGEDTSWGWQVGSTWQINEDHRLGFAYKSEVVMDFDGHAESIFYGKKPGMMSIALPATAELASFHQLNEQWAVHASINWTDWSSFKELTAVFSDGPEPIKLENWEDNYRFAVGTTYQYDAKLALRAGVAYDTSAVNDTYRTATIPETDRTWVSLGASYMATPQLTLDAGFTYIFAKDATINEPRDPSDYEAAELGGAFNGNVSGNIWLIGVQANYRF